MRYKMTFSKTEEMRYTGHLDLHTTLERTMRRANLPLVYSQGFTPRPKLSLASALPLGYTSESELAEFWLKEDVPLKDLIQALQASAPPGLTIHKVQTAAKEEPKLQNALTGAEFQISFQQEDPNLPEKVDAMLAKQEIPREKLKKGKKKTYDLRALILGAEVIPSTSEEPQKLKLRLQAVPGATGRPDEVLEELGIDPLSPDVHRTKLIF